MFMELKWLVLGAFGLVTLIQLFYYVGFFSRLAFFKSKTNHQSSREQPVSVVICARDEADNLEKNLPGVLVQQYGATHEVVVVNDNSQDESRYLLEGIHRQFRQLHIVDLKQEAKLIPGKKFPLSMGIRTAKHEVLLLTDADCIPASEHWIKKMQEPLRDGVEIVLGYGAYKKKKGFLNKMVRFETFHSALQYLSYALAGIPYMGVGRNLAYRRELFIKNKGFSSHNHIAGGDDDLFINMTATPTNTAIVIDQEAHTLSNPSTTFGAWYRQKNRHYSTSKYYKPLHKFLLGLYSLTHFLFYPALITALILSDWKITLGMFGFKLLIQAIIYYRVMHKLNEKDLFGWFLLFDLLQPIYYLLFSSAVITTQKSEWK